MVHGIAFALAIWLMVAAFNLADWLNYHVNSKPSVNYSKALFQLAILLALGSLVGYLVQVFRQ